MKSGFGSIVIPAPIFEDLRQCFQSTEEESAVVLLASRVGRADGYIRFLCREIVRPSEDDFLTRSPYAVALQPSFVAAAIKRARNENCALVFAHSHLGSQPPSFSGVDDHGEQELIPALSRRAPGLHASLVLSSGGASARLFGSRSKGLGIVSVGRELRYIDQSERSHTDDLIFDRQVRAFGREGQALLRSLRVAIVGLGGTGSLVAEYLAHLGVRRLVLMDPDVVEATNLNRLVGATEDDVRTLKVEVACRLVTRIRRDAEVETIPESVLLDAVAKRLRDVDFVFACTDSHGSRAVLNQFAYQYLVPAIDVGVGIVAHQGRIRNITGRVQMLAPGLGCLLCGGILDPELVRRDLLTEFERQSDPYIQGEHNPQPAVLSLNATMSSLGVTMFMAAVAGVPSAARMQLYNGLTGTVRAASAVPDAQCFVCGPESALGHGDSWDLPARRIG